MSETHSQVIELLRAESDAIAKAASRLQASDIDPAINVLARCRGKVIVLGRRQVWNHWAKDCGNHDEQRHGPRSFCIHRMPCTADFACS